MTAGGDSVYSSVPAAPGPAAVTNPDETIRVLRAALAATPDNVDLRLHLADLLRAGERHDEAIVEYRAGLKAAPSHVGLKLGLADAYFRSGKDSHAGVVLESVLAGGDPPPAARVLLARIRLREGDVPGAVAAYREALDADPSCEEKTLSEHLGVRPGAPDDDEEDDGGEDDGAGEVFEGRLRARGPADGDPDEEHAGRRIERPTIDFDAVGGMESVKEEIDIKIIQPLLQPKLFEAYGKPIGGGILMYGPPGCGKTHLARATAGQVDAKFLCVGLSDVLDMWVGKSERNLHALFQRARRSTPFVLFFDEVDALGASRSDFRDHSMRMVINQFLEELDGAKESNDGVLVLAATNAPWHLDSAFRRPGRFDRVLFVPPPDAAARASILRVMLEGKPAGALDLEKVARKTEGFSGADLKGVVDVAIEEKLRAAMKTGRPVPLETADLVKAVKKVRPSTRDWFATARNYVLYSNEGGLYDDVAKYLDL